MARNQILRLLLTSNLTKSSSVEMPTILFTAAIFVLMCVAFLIQEFIPAMQIAYNAHLMLVPVVFFAAAVTLPFPLMLAMAFFTGFVWDARHLLYQSSDEAVNLFQAGGGDVDLALGYSILLFGLMGAFMQGIRPLFQRGRWELPVIMIGAATLVWLVLEYLLINFRAGDFFFPKAIFVKALTAALLSMVVAPFIFILYHRVAALCGYQIRYDGLRNRSYGH